MRPAERGTVVGIVVAVAVALRWCFVATAEVQSPLRADAGQYAQYAKNLIEHGTYSLATSIPPLPDSFRSPGYPFFLAACRLVAGGGGWQSLALAIQVLLGAGTVLVTYRLARHWLSFPAAVAAAGACALSPHLVAAGGYVLTECLTTFVLCSGMLLLANAKSVAWLVAAGLCLGAAVLCNETLLFVPVVLAWPLARAHGLSRGALCVVLALLPWGLWTARNATQPLARTGSERATASISHGSYPDMVFADPRLRGFPYREDPEQPVFGSSWRDLGRVLGPRIAAQPWRYLGWYLGRKPLWLWSWDLVQGRDVLVYEVANNPFERQPVVAATHWAMRLLHLPAMLLAAGAMLAGAWNARRRGPPFASMLALVALFATLAHLPVIPDPRYLNPVRPLLFVLAAGGAAACVGAVAARRRAKLPAAA